MEHIKDMLSTAEGGALDKLKAQQAQVEKEVEELLASVKLFQEERGPEAEELAKQLEAPQSFEQVPNSVPPDVINHNEKLQTTGGPIIRALDRSGVERALEAREAYANIAKDVKMAQNITELARQVCTLPLLHSLTT